MTDRDKEIEELIFWLNWTARQLPETVTEVIDLPASPMLDAAYINLN